MEPKIHHGGGLNALPGPVDGRGEAFITLQCIVAKWDQRGQTGVGRGLSPQGVAVMAVEMDVTVDKSRQDELALGIYIAVGGREQLLGSQGDDFLAGDGYGRLVYLG